MFWDKITIKNPEKTTKGYDVKFSHEDYDFRISFKILHHHGISDAENLKNKTIIFDKNKKLKFYRNEYSDSKWLKIESDNIIEITENNQDYEKEEELKTFNSLKKYNNLDAKYEDLNIEKEEEYDQHFLEGESLKKKDWSKTISEIDFNQIYNSIESYKINKISEVMNHVDKLIEKSIKLTPSKYKNKKQTKNYYSFNMLFDFADEQLINFLNGKLNVIRISFPKDIKLPANTKKDPDKIINFLDEEKLLSYSTKTNIENFKKNKISVDELLAHIIRNRNNNFTRFKEIQKEANKIKNETGVNPLVIAWPYLKGKTNQGTAFHCPIAYTNIEIEESINYFEINRMSNFEINTYPILKNYSEKKGFVNKIIPSFDSLKDCLVEFFKHGIKILSPNSNEFIDYTFIDIKNTNEFDSMTNDFFHLSNEVALIMKDHDEFINYDLREIKAVYGKFDIPKKTSTLINDEEENRERNYCLDLDNSKVTAIKKSIENSTVIFGPPGTGKSESITAIITEIVKNFNNSIFVAEKNTAINVVESNLKKVGFHDFMINLNNNSKKQFQEKFNNQIELIFKPYEFEVPNHTLVSKNFAENWLREIETNKDFYEMIDSKDIKLIFEFISWFNEIIISAEVTNVIDLKNKINKCKEDELNQENYYANLIPQIKIQKEHLVDLKHKVKNQENSLIYMIENKIRELNENLEVSNNLILTWGKELKTTILFIIDKLKRVKDFSKEQEAETIKEKQTILEELKKHLENSSLIKKYIDVSKPEEFEEISKINDINEFFIFINNKRPLMFKKKIKKNLVDIKKLMNSIKEHWNKYAENETKIKKQKLEINQLIEKIELFELFDINNINQENKSTLVQNNMEIEKYFDQENAIKFFLSLVNSIVKTKAEIKSTINQKDFLSNLIEDKTNDFMKNLDTNNNQLLMNISQMFYRNLSSDLFELRENYGKISNQIRELQKSENKIQMIDIESIDINVSWLKKQNLNNIEILIKDEKIKEIINFYSINKDQLDISKNLKWEKFKKNKKTELNNVIHAIKIKWSKKIKEKYNDDDEFKEDLDTLKNYVENKLNKRNVSVHSLFETEKSLEVLKTIFPCIAMDPETASKIIPIKKNIFDYGIFDEASQIRLHKAIPILHRSEKVVVAGDDKQLGPMDLFSSIDDEENDELLFNQENDFNNKTLLDFAKDRYQNFKLLTHYRSKAKDLIEFSNDKFYKNAIETADSPLARYDGKNPIILEDINGKWENKTNLDEAKRVVELAKYYLIEQQKTLGIITFNINQEQLINQLLAEDNELRPYLNKFDKLFVKRIKNVQGDEKEVIIFSIAYGMSKETGRYVKNYGNFSKEKINVAITRSQLRMHVLKSIPSSEISRSSEDYRIFAEWLEFIEMKNSEPDNVIEHKNIFRSQFEEDYFDLLNVLLPKHIIPLANYKADSKEIDIALYNTENYKFVGAIELDGIRHHSSSEQILKDFDRQNFLELLGWKFVRVSPINFYNNRKKCIIEDLSKHDINI